MTASIPPGPEFARVHRAVEVDGASAHGNRLDWRAEELAEHSCMASVTPQEVLQAATRQLAAFASDRRVHSSGE
jgi:hypothetical protein